MADLRFTDTNAADDSGGSVWGLDGNLFIPVIISLVVSIGLILVLFGAFQWHWLASAIVGLLPFGCTLGYVLLFKQGKPPGYDKDLFELYTTGNGFSYNPGIQNGYRPPTLSRELAFTPRRHDKAPNGHFAEDLILYGNLETGAIASKGFIIEPPDLHDASASLLNEFQDKERIFLGMLGAGQRAQFQWTCNSDYQRELSHYWQETAKVADPVVKRARNERFSRYWEKMLNRNLRREQLVLFISQDVATYSGNWITKSALADYYSHTLGQLKNEFNELGVTLQTVFGNGTTVRPMTDLDHFAYTKRFLNPSLANVLKVNFEELYRPEYTIQELCWDSDGVGIDGKTGFYLDGHYHVLFTVKRWPHRTYPGLIRELTGLPFLDYQITINIEPIAVREEIVREEKAMDRLRGDYEHQPKQSLRVALAKKENKINALAGGFSYPFSVQYLIRVWDSTEAGLHAKCASIKNAVSGMNGAQTYEVALPTTARKLFFSSWPGWTGTSYRHRYLYAQDQYLSDLLPFSSTYTAHLADAEALYDGTNGNLVGVRTFVGGTPQHAVLFGMTGAGKSYLMNDLLTQTQPYYHYTVLIEEGASYSSYTESLGEKTLYIQPDGQLTLNYLDTQGLPLNQLHVATAVALVSRMIGESSNNEKQQLRQAQIGQYIEQLYRDTFEDWARRHPDSMPGLQRMACAVNRWRTQKLERGATTLEAYADLRDKMEALSDEALTFYNAISEAELTKFIKEAHTEREVMAMAYSAFKPEEYPTHSTLIEALRASRFPEHSEREINDIATLLSAWSADGGAYGKLFDGITNVSLTGRIAHFELGAIPEQAIELKTAAGLLISGFTRQHIVTLPRHLWKRIVFEEVARFLDVPGGEKIVAESYAQLRKFNCWTISIVQQYSKFKSSRIRPVVIGNSKQFFLMRQLDHSDLEDVARDIHLSKAAIDAIQHYPLPEQQPQGRKFSSVCYYAPSAQPPLCGTLRHISAPDTFSNPHTTQTTKEATQ